MHRGPSKWRDTKNWEDLREEIKEGECLICKGKIDKVKDRRVVCYNPDCKKRYRYTIQRWWSRVKAKKDWVKKVEGIPVSKVKIEREGLIDWGKDDDE
jgi:hypothetical protein